MNKTKENISAVGIAAAVICAYAQAVCVLPSSGILSSLPTAIVFSAIAVIFCRTRWLIYLSMGLMPFLTSLLYNFDTEKAVQTAIFSAVISALTVLAIRALKTALKAKKIGKRSIFSKSCAVFCVSAVLAVILQAVLFGSPISLKKADSANTESAEKLYGEAIECGKTHYDAFSHSYLTEISFDGGDPKNHYYFADGSKDDFEEFIIDGIVLDAKDYFASHSALDASEILCRIDSENFVYSADYKSEDYFSQAEYLLVRNETVTGVTNFGKLYREIMKYALSSEDLEYACITVAAKDTDGNVYYAVKLPGKSASFSKDGGETLESLQNKFGK